MGFCTAFWVKGSTFLQESSQIQGLHAHGGLFLKIPLLFIHFSRYPVRLRPLPMPMGAFSFYLHFIRYPF